MSDTARRSLVKTVSWRLTGSGATFLISYLIAGDFAIAGTIATVQLVSNTVLYFVHERIWNKIRLGPTLILPDFILHSRVNQRWDYSGLDSFKHCLDKQHFKQYPYSITYNYNNRGYRDREWPEPLSELQQAVWCLGDSFTVGIGSPLEHTWPWILEQQLQQRTINVSMDGASNDWIARRATDILQQIQPQHMVIHWTYFHRREHPDTTRDDEDRRLDHVRDTLDLRPQLDNFKLCVNQVEQNRGQCQIIHSIIPNSYPGPKIDSVKDSWKQIAGSSWPSLLPLSIEDIPKDIVEEIKTIHQNWDFFEEHYYTQNFLNQLMAGLNNIGWIEQIDLARDGLHYDLKTSQSFVGSVIQQWNNRTV